jgi:hypothetical protein
MRNMVTLSRRLKQAAICLLLAALLLLPRPCSATPPPVITVQPLSQTVQILGSVTFTVTASSGTTMSYQWSKNSATIAGATLSSYTIATVQTTDAGTYSVKVTNAKGSVTSSGATLTVLAAPTITTQPVSQVGTQGLSASFSVAILGGLPLSYQWQLSGTSLAGATNAALALTNIQTTDAGNYTMVVTNSWGSMTSAVATLTVLVPPGITTQPQSQAVVVGQSARFSVSASGTVPFSYRWSFNGAQLSGATSSTLTLANVQTTNAGSYMVVVTNAAGSATSAVASLTVYVPAGIATQPSSQTATLGQNATFSVVATGTAPLSYQWQATNTASGGFTNLTNGGQISGANTNVLNISNVTTNNAPFWQVIITNDYGAVTSSPAILIVPPPVLLVDIQFLGTSSTTWPSGGGSPQTGAAILGASGDTWNQEDLTYYVYPGTSTDIYASNLVNSLNAASGLTLTIGSSPNSVFGGQQPNATATDPATTNLMSSAIEQFALTANVDVWTITVGGLSAYTGEQFNLVVYAGAPSARTQTISVSGGASGGNTSSALTTSSTSRKLSAGAGVAYQVFTNGTLNGSNLVFTVNGGTAAVNTYAAFLNGFQLQIFNYPVITTQPTNLTVMQSLNATFSVVASGTAPLGYQWNFNGTNLSGATSSALTLANVQTTNAGSYAVVVTNAAGSATSAVAILTVLVPPGITTQPQSQMAVVGQSATFSVTASGTAPFSYRWSFNGTQLSGATSSALTLANVQTTSAGSYTVVVTNAAGSATSAVATLTVYVPAGIATQPSSQTTTQGLNVAFSVVPSGTAPFSYQWCFNSAPLSGATSSALALTNVQTTDAGSYTVVLTNTWGSVTSAVATLTVLVPAGIATQPQSQAVVVGQSPTFSVSASGTAPFSYQWRFNGTASPGATSSALTLSNVQSNKAGNYLVVVTNAAGSVTSAVATLTVYVPAGIATQPSSQTTTQGLNVAFSVVPSGMAPFSYQWCLNGAPLSGATSSALALTNVQTTDAASYTVVVTNTWGSVTSAVATLTVLVPVGIATQPQSQAVVVGQSPTFSVSASGTAPFSYQWLFNGTASPGATSSALTLSNVQSNKAGNYLVVVTNAAGSVTSAVATLTVYVPAGIATQPSSQTTTQGLNAAFSVVPSGTAPFSYQWCLNGAPLSGATSSALALTNVQTTDAGSYTLVVTNTWGSVTGAVATLTVLVPPGITTQPQSQAVVVGQSPTFTVIASGTAPFSYQWRFNGTSLAGATKSALTLSNVQSNKAGSYLVVAMNSAGSVTSGVATLTVYVPPTITTQPLSQTVTQGLNATFSVVASGTPPFSYQWQFRGTALPGATNPTLVVMNVQYVQAGNYGVTVTNPWGTAVSASALLTVAVPPGSDRPTMQGLVAHLTFDADLTDSSGRGNHATAVGAPNLVPGFIGAGGFNPFTQNGTNNYATFGTPSDLSFGATSDFSIAFWARLPAGGWGGASYTEPPFIGNKDFSSYANIGWVLATGADGKLEWNYTEAWPNSQHNYFGPAGAFGNPIWHHVAVTFQRGTINTATTYLDGLPVSTVSLGLLTTSIDTGLPTNIGNDGTGNYPTAYGYFTNVFGIPTNGLAMDDLGIWRRALSASEIGAIYNVGLAGQDLSTVTSSNLTTVACPRIIQSPVGLEVLAGSNVAFSVTANGTALAYQWYGNGVCIAGATGASLILSNVQPTQAGSYCVVITNSSGNATSAVASLTVDAPPSITVQASSQAVMVGQNASFSVVASGTTPLSYQWSLNGTALSGATSSALTLANVQTTDAGNYTVVVTNSLGSVTSALATLTVNVTPEITTQPLAQTVTAGQNVSFSIVGTGTAPLNYQWSFNGTALAGASTSALTLANVQTTDAGSYTVVVTNVAGSVTGAVATLTVYVPPTITTQPLSQTVTQGQSASFSVVASGTALLSYQWTRNGTALTEVTTSALTLADLQATDAGSYMVVVANAAGSVTGAVATLTVLIPPAITTQPQAQTVIVGQSATFSVVATGSAPLGYQWSRNGTAVSGATDSMLTLNTAQSADAGSYTVMVTDVAGSVPSMVATLTVIPPTPPSFDSAGMTPNGFAFQLSVPVGCTYVILATTNLQDWTPISTNVALTGSVVVTDPAATNCSRQFYRAMVQ